MAFAKHAYEKTLHALFNAGIIVKAIDSLGEIALGLLFYFLGAPTINRIVMAVFGDELTEQPRGAVWNFLFHGWHGVSNGGQYFLAYIFLAHGLAKISLVIGLVKDKMWIYPLAAMTFALFAFYQAYHIIAVSPSLLLSVLTVFDAIFVVLIIHEYRYQKENRRLQPAE